MSRQTIQTTAAPAAIGPYSQAIAVDRMVFLSGQIPLDPQTGQLITGGIEAQVRQAFGNLQAVCEAAGGELADCVKLTLFLTDLNDFAVVNQTMQTFFQAPYPARSTVQVSALPKGASFEVEAIMVRP
ncbi:MAG: RidA family protein [Betaproteobacteria bacterium]|nr:RidA family protein [Betaproteobacteria bacterium]NCW81281.1 RidA family protein [Betaproteobacteria bacterium]NDA92434.1 RidA family protein [Betaproteobacteria bacterium]NDE46847.1 RidA family protein [Betaproteobacteria bacterium]NDF50525.1 RidA family protein [Betaproteobacteria bacterium]